MKIHSICSFENHDGLAGLKKGEQDFDPSKLRSDKRAYFDGLVKAGIVTILEEKLETKLEEPPSPPSPPPPPPPEPPTEPEQLEAPEKPTKKK